ncbi:MAG: hypothetical protein O7C69_08530 [Gammaproteobacteria bacterium]|nr:hypothetical protein [Gammaproteobacteria bacterium]
MPINLFHWPAAITLLVAGMLFAPQVVCSSEADTTDIDSASTPVIEFQAFSTAGQYADALAVAARVIDQASDYPPETRALLVEPLMKLATIQKQADEILGAERAGELAIDLIERNGGIFDPALVEPLVFLAQLQQDNGNHPAALEHLNRAQHIVHRADGVMSPRQLPILARMIKSYSATKQPSRTNLMIEQAYAIRLRHMDENSVEAVPVILEQAEIRAMNGQFRKARELIYLGLEILEGSLPENDPRLFDVLNGLVSVRYKEQLSGGSGVSGYRLGRKEGTRTLQRMIAIIEEHPEQFSLVRHAEVYIWLGDWYMITRKIRLSNESYRTAWKILSDQENAAELLANYFGQPRRLRYKKPTPPRRGAGMYEIYYGRFIEVSFSVKENGEAREVRLGISNSPAAMSRRMRQAVMRAIYRPRYVNAQPVVTKNLFLREEFSRGAWPARD